MKELNENQMLEISGGGITSSIINSIVKVVGAIYNLGEKTGSSIRRIVSRNYCPAN